MCFAEALLMSTHNICFCQEIRNYLPDTHSYLDLWNIYSAHFCLQYICCGSYCKTPWIVALKRIRLTFKASSKICSRRHSKLFFIFIFQIKKKKKKLSSAAKEQYLGKNSITQSAISICIDLTTFCIMNLSLSKFCIQICNMHILVCSFCL